MTQEVLVLEVDDPAIKRLLDEIRQKVSKGKVPQKAHITIRGPYAQRIRAKTVEDVRNRLRAGDKIRIVGVSRFSSSSEDVVYLALDSDELRKVWWKPDFPISRFGFNPHITLFRGDPSQADEVETWVRKRGIEESLSKWHLSTDAIGQKSFSIMD